MEPIQEPYGFTRLASRICAMFVLVVSLLVFAGWIWNMEVIKSIHPQYAPMKANAALCFLLSGAALLLMSGQNQALRRLAPLPVLLTIVLAGMVMMQHLIRSDLGIDQLLFTDTIHEGHQIPGRMALNTTLCFLLISAGALLLARKKPALKAAQILFALSFLIAWAALLSYSYKVKGFTGIDSNTQMALHTSVCIIVLATGFMLLSPQKGYLVIVSPGYTAGSAVLSLLLTVLLLPVLVGSAIMQGYHSGRYNLGFALALFGVTYTLLLLGVLYTTFRNLHSAELERLRQGQQVTELNRKLTASLRELSLSEEELKAANEELQERNHDLQLANKELTDAKAEVEHLSAEALRAVEQRYSQLTDSMEEIFRVLDKDLRTVYCNKAAERAFGMPREMNYGKTLTQILGPERGARLDGVYRKVVETGATVTETELIHSPEGTKHLELTAYPTADGGAFGVVRDITKRTEDEEKLKFYKYLMDHSPDPMYWIDPQDNFRFAYVNEAAARHYGLPAEKLLTMSIPDWDPTFTEETCRNHQAEMKEKKAMQFETLHRSADGREIPVEINTFLLEFGGREYLAGHFRDISVRKRAEAALRESEEKYRNLFESNIDPLLLIDMETLRILDVNPAACKAYGYTREELLNLKNIDLSAQPEETLNATLGKKNFVKERYHRRKDGTVFPVEISASFTTHNGRPVSIGASRDVTERVGFTRKLEEEKQRLELALWGGNLGLWDWDVQTGKVVFNENYATMLGYSPEELLPEGDVWLRLLHPEDKPPALEALELHLTGRQAFFQVEQRLKCKDGEWKWILGSGKVISRDADGNPMRMVGTHADISDRKRYERKMLHLNEELEVKVSERTAQLQTVNHELEAFSYSVSHDLRSPLRSIDGFSKMLLTDYESVLDEEGKDYLHTIRAASQRMGHLIDDLLKLARISRTELYRYRVDMSAMAVRLLKELLQESPERKVTWRVAPGLVVQADSRLLQIALQNLLSNAWKYSSKKEESNIEVGKRSTGRGEAFFVQDNGAGFDMKYAGRLFGAFQRIHSSRDFEGTGIGLAIVHRIIVRHGGEIWVEAEPNRGAAFFFTLPDHEPGKHTEEEKPEVSDSD